MITYHLRAWNNATFRLTRNLASWAALHDLSSAKIRMQARAEAEDADPPLYEWVTDATSGGLVTYDPATKFIAITAPLADMRGFGAGVYVYDCRLELADDTVAVLFGGRLQIVEGVTRAGVDSASLASAAGDTVTVAGEMSSAAGALPVSVTAILSAAQAQAQGLLGGLIGFGHGAPGSGEPAGELLYFDLDSRTLYVRAPDGSWVAIAGGGSGGGVSTPSLDFSDPDNSGYAPLLFLMPVVSGSGSGSSGSTYSPSLDLSDPRNSGYAPLLFLMPAGSA